MSVGSVTATCQVAYQCRHLRCSRRPRPCFHAFRFPLEDPGVYELSASLRRLLECLAAHFDIGAYNLLMDDRVGTPKPEHHHMLSVLMRISH
jgi:hypothetical protein